METGMFSPILKDPTKLPCSNNKIYAASFMIHHLRPRLPSNNYIVMPYSPRKTILLCSYAGLNLKLTIL